MSRTIAGQLVDLYNREIFPAEITIENGKIIDINKANNDKIYSRYILPGFIDSHIHIESSMLAPTAFAAEAVRFGTIATVSDPHEIANVLGRKGVDFMITMLGHVRSNSISVPLLAYPQPNLKQVVPF